MSSAASFALVFLVAAGLTAALTPVAQRIGLRIGAADVPGGRRQHAGRVSRLGGIAMFGAFAVVLLLVLAFPGLFPASQDPNERTRLGGVLIGCAFVFVLGLLDDKRELNGWQQIAIQIAASGIAMGFLIFIQVINNPLNNRQVWFPWFVTVPLTAAWIAGSMTTVNLLDGLDGLAGGVVAIAAALLAAHMVREGQTSVALLPLALLGATIGFLPFNFHPARVFMGSAGAYFLGYAVGTLSIVAGGKVATLLLVLGIPIIDVAWQIVARIRRHQPVGQGDRGHLHFRLQDMGWSQRRIVLLYYLFCALFGALAFFIPSRLFKLVALVVLGLLVIGVLAWATRRGQQAPDSAQDGTRQ